jgi:hypothetical protein
LTGDSAPLGLSIEITALIAIRDGARIDVAVVGFLVADLFKTLATSSSVTCGSV